MKPTNGMLCGHAHVFGDDINTDLISPAKYMELSDAEIAAHAMAGVDPDFSRKIQAGDILVAGRNFGSGSSRETAPAALKNCGISLVIARLFARIFYRNCLNIGLPVLICERANEISDMDSLEVDLSAGRIYDATKDLTLTCAALPPHILQLIEHGGLVELLKTDWRKSHASGNDAIQSGDLPRGNQ